MAKLLTKEDIIAKYLSRENKASDEELNQAAERTYEQIKRCQFIGESKIFVGHLDSRAECEYAKNYLITRLKEKGYDLTNEINASFYRFRSKCEISLDLS